MAKVVREYFRDGRLNSEYFEINEKQEGIFTRFSYFDEVCPIEEFYTVINNEFYGYYKMFYCGDVYATGIYLGNDFHKKKYR